MRGSHVATDAQVSELSDQEAADVFDGICRRELHISGREFLNRWDSGGQIQPVEAFDSTSSMNNSEGFFQL
jgi:hypothetical protein